jgi:hypothetical protein
MKILAHKLTLFLMAGAILCGSFVVYVKYSGACNLEKVTVNDRPVADWRTRYALSGKKSIVDQPLDDVARLLLIGKNIYRVDFSPVWPNGLNIRTNKFTPVCFLLDVSSGQLFGLDNQARLISLDKTSVEWERPVFTGLEAGRLFSRPKDVRAKVVLDQLESLREQNRDLYRLIDEVDFSTAAFVVVSMAGVPYRLNLRAEDFLQDMDRFAEFTTRFDPDLDSTALLDLRFDDMIIARKGKN